METESGRQKRWTVLIPLDDNQKGKSGGCLEIILKNYGRKQPELSEEFRSACGDVDLRALECLFRGGGDKASPINFAIAKAKGFLIAKTGSAEAVERVAVEKVKLHGCNVTGVEGNSATLGVCLGVIAAATGIGPHRFAATGCLVDKESNQDWDCFVYPNNESPADLGDLLTVKINALHAHFEGGEKEGKIPFIAWREAFSAISNSLMSRNNILKIHNLKKHVAAEYFNFFFVGTLSEAVKTLRRGSAFSPVMFRVGAAGAALGLLAAGIAVIDPLGWRSPPWRVEGLVVDATQRISANGAQVAPTCGAKDRDVGLLRNERMLLRVEMRGTALSGWTPVLVTIPRQIDGRAPALVRPLSSDWSAGKPVPISPFDGAIADGDVLAVIAMPSGTRAEDVEPTLMKGLPDELHHWFDRRTKSGTVDQDRIVAALGAKALAQRVRVHERAAPDTACPPIDKALQLTALQNALDASARQPGPATDRAVADAFAPIGEPQVWITPAELEKAQNARIRRVNSLSRVELFRAGMKDAERIAPAIRGDQRRAALVAALDERYDGELLDDAALLMRARTAKQDVEDARQRVRRFHDEMAAARKIIDAAEAEQRRADALAQLKRPYDDPLAAGASSPDADASSPLAEAEEAGARVTARRRIERAVAAKDGGQSHDEILQRLVFPGDIAVMTPEQRNTLLRPCPTCMEELFVRELGLAVTITEVTRSEAADLYGTAASAWLCFESGMTALSLDRPGFDATPGHPATCVIPFRISHFASALSRSRIPGLAPYRLPTEAEGQALRKADAPEGPPACQPRTDGPRPSADLPAGRIGLKGTAGNVAEWVCAQPSDGDCKVGKYLGGYWNGGCEGGRFSDQKDETTGSPWNHVGFRLVRRPAPLPTMDITLGRE